MFDTGRGCSLLSETTDVGRSNDSRSSQELSTYHSKYIHDTICSDYVHCRINVTATAHWCENLGCSVVDSCSASLLFERGWLSDGTNNERSSQELSTYHSKYIHDTICSDYVHCRINVTATAHWCENLGCSVVDSCSASLLFERGWLSDGTNNERSSQELSTYHSKYIQDVADKCLMKQLPPERR